MEFHKYNKEPHIILTNFNRLLTRLETLGNRLPHPTMVFVGFCGLVLVLSWLCAWLGLSAQHPVSAETIEANNLLNAQGLRDVFSKAVVNFTGFAPVGTVLVAIMGIGVAEHSGLLSAILRVTVLKAPQKMLSFFIVLAGVLSSLAADTGYVVLVPLAAIIFISVGRHPLVGIAAAFAGVSGGYSANLLIGPLDAILAGISTEAAQLIDPLYEVSAAGNYYFVLASTFLIAIVGSWVTEKIVAPRFESETVNVETHNSISAQDKKALLATLVFTLGFIAILLFLTLPENAVLRNPETGSLLRSPFISSIVVIISFYAALAGLVFGKVSGEFKNSDDFIEGMEKAMATMASYLVLMFFAAQFVNYFSWSNLGVIFAINGAELLQMIKPDSSLLLILFVLLAALINLLIGSASAKWALIAPVFIPMLLLVGITPEAAQMAYRIGDSSTNIITPLMPYFGVVLAFARKYQPETGMGTLIALMLPYSLCFLLCWSVMLVLWGLLALPLGPDSMMFIE